MFGRYNQNGTSSYVEDPSKDTQGLKGGLGLDHSLIFHP